MGEIISGLFTYLSALWRTIGYALTLNQDLFAWFEANEQARLLAIGLVVLAGASSLLGQSVILFVNRVRKGRFFLSLFVNGLLLAVEYVVVAIVIRIVGGLVIGAPIATGTLFRMVALSTAPLVFGFFVLMPYMGPVIGRILSVWSALILIGVVRYHYQSTPWEALVVVGIAWLAMLALTNTIGKPVIALRNRIWHRVVGSSLDATAEDILLEYARDRSQDMKLGG